jgi:hypothetical protein
MSYFWSLIWFFFWTFAFIAYLIALFSVVADLFRDTKLAGGWKALWLLFLVFVPFFAVLVYVIARGDGMADRSARKRGVERMSESQDEEIVAASAPSPASDIATAKDLLDRGIISAGEFEALKAKALGEKY